MADVEEKMDMELTTESNEKSKKSNKYTPESVKVKTASWLSCELRLDDFSIKNQSFSVTGWINVFWKWEKAPKELQRWDGKCDIKTSINNKTSKMIMYPNNEGHDIIKILDLRKSDISYYLPIDARKVFNQPSLQRIHHIDAPCLYYNKQTMIAHTQYYINAVLLEHLELFLFPFDRQFLNMKLRFNVDYYRILDFEQERNIPIEGEWWGKKERISCDRDIELYHVKPLKISLKESIKNEVKMIPAWIDFRIIKGPQKNSTTNLRFALIRLRVRRNPMYFITNILFPFFIIVSCSFSVFAISRNNVGERLSVSVTILLTFTAFQSIIAEELPQTSAMLLIDWYIGIAYLIQALLVLGSCIASLDEHINDQFTELIDILFATILGSFWILFSLFYLSLRFATFRNCYDCCCCKCINYNDWNKRGNQEIDDWANNETVCFDKVVRE